MSGSASGGGGGTSGASGSGAVSGASGSGASGGSTSTCAGVPYPSIAACNMSCGSRIDGQREVICVDGAWGCYPELVPVWECAPDSCARASDHWCCASDGNATPVTCDDAGNVEPCPAGSVDIARRTLCAPAYVRVQSCHELDATICPHSGDRCQLVGACSEECECMGASDLQVWSCITPLC